MNTYRVYYYTLSDGKNTVEIDAESIEDAIQKMIAEDERTQKYCFAQLISFTTIQSSQVTS